MFWMDFFYNINNQTFGEKNTISNETINYQINVVVEDLVFVNSLKKLYVNKNIHKMGNEIIQNTELEQQIKNQIYVL